MKKRSISFVILMAALSVWAFIASAKYFYLWVNGKIEPGMVLPYAMAAFILVGVGIMLAVIAYYAFNSDSEGNYLKKGGSQKTSGGVNEKFN